MRSAAQSSMAPVSASRQWSRSTAAMPEFVSANPMPSASSPVIWLHGAGKAVPGLRIIRARQPRWVVGAVGRLGPLRAQRHATQRGVSQRTDTAGKLATSPRTFIGDVANFPAVLLPLTEQPRWVAWRWVRKNEKWTKPPYRADDPAQLARTDDPQTWNCFSSAVKAVTGGLADGIGFALTNSGIAAVDLDHCRDAETGAIDDWAADLISQVPGAYTEITASGCGLRIIGRGVGDELHRKFEIKDAHDGAAIELYRRATRYITVSGLEVGTCDELPDIDNLLDGLVAEHARSHTDGERTIRDIIRNGSPVGQRSEDFNRVVWSLAGMGYDADKIEKRLVQHPDGIAAKYAGRLRDEIERCYAKWESAGDTSTTGATWGDPDWSLLDDRRGALPEFPTAVLSDKWQEWLVRTAHGAGVTHGHVVVPLLATVASLIGTARRIRPSRSWSEPFTLWTAIVGFSGSGKTPGIGVTKRALSLIESTRKSQIAELQRRHETKSQTVKAAAKAWKDEVEEAVKANLPPPEMPVAAMDPGIFVTPRLYVSEATIERHAVLLQARPRGTLLMSDELASLFLNMGRYSNGSDKEFWLEAWNGQHYVVERMGRPPVMIDHLLIGMTGGFQPDKLARSFKGDSDGTHARVLFAWPEEAAFHSLTDDVTEVEPELLNALGRIIDLPAGEEDDVFAPRDIRLSTDARIQFEQFRQFQHRHKDALDGREREWWAKGPSQVLRLAGTLCYLDWAIGGGPEPQIVDALHRICSAAVAQLPVAALPRRRAPDWADRSSRRSSSGPALAEGRQSPGDFT